MEFTKKKTNRDFKEIAGSFFSAASVFSKRLQRWRQQKKRRRGITGDGSAVERRKLGDTQSEFGGGRRSCDTDPRFSIDAGRFSLDAGRVSVDDPRYSFDEPRASWDGYLIGRAVAPPRMVSILSAVEDSPARNQVLRSDKQTPAKQSPPPPPDETIPGGSEQTREYYSGTSSRRRKSLDRSSSSKKLSASIMAEIDELKLSVSHTKASNSHSHSHSHSNSLRDDCSLENLKNVEESSKKGTKKSRRWSWNIFGLLNRKNGNKCKEKEGGSGVDRTFSGSWNVETRRVFDPKMMRSNSSVSWRSSGIGGEVVRRNSVDGYVSGKKDVSSSNGRRIDDGMLKLYSASASSKGKGR